MSMGPPGGIYRTTTVITELHLAPKYWLQWFLVTQTSRCRANHVVLIYFHKNYIVSHDHLTKTLIKDMKLKSVYL